MSVSYTHLDVYKRQVFAQLERETIQKRVTDAYYSRCLKGFHMSGQAPYGYQLEPTVVEGIRTKKMVAAPPIEIPASVETIEAAAFMRCSKLATVTFEKGSQLKTIGGDYSSSCYYGVFSDCTALKSIEIPASVETIEAAAFKGILRLFLFHRLRIF